MSLDQIMHLRYQEKSCANCRYYRESETGGVTSECLLLGRTLGIIGSSDAHRLSEWAYMRLCDGWKKRPSTWDVFSRGPDNNPHWYDPYIPREKLLAMRERLERRGGKPQRSSDGTAMRVLKEFPQ